VWNSETLEGIVVHREVIRIPDTGKPPLYLYVENLPTPPIEGNAIVFYFDAFTIGWFAILICKIIFTFLFFLITFGVFFISQFYNLKLF